MSNPFSPREWHINRKPVTVVIYFLMFCLTAVLVFWLNLSWRPDMSQLPPDSGFYAYFGKAILHGQLPYRDVWDDKPPLGYYLNALGQLIFGQTPSGVWWSSVLWIVGCTVLLFLVIRKLFGTGTAAITSALFVVGLMNPQLFQGGNLMEVYALAPQIGVIGLTYYYFSRNKQPWFAGLVGGLTACAYLIKQPTIMLGFSSIFLMAVRLLSQRKFRETLTLLIAFIIGFAGVLAIALVYWLWNGALKQLLDGLFVQGVSFIGGPQSRFVFNFLATLIRTLPRLYIGWLYIVAAITGFVFLLQKLFEFRGVSRSSRNLSPIEWTWMTALIALPLEAFSASLGGKYYGHYFITMLPAVVTAVAYALWKVVTGLKEVAISKGGFFRFVFFALIAFAAIAWGAASFVRDLPPSSYTKDLRDVFSRQIRLNDLEQYIVLNSQASDKVLVWHIHLGINFVTDRWAPSRFLYPLNLFIPPSQQNTKLAEFVDDLETHPPKLIVVQKISSLGLPFVDTPVDDQCKTPCTPDFTQAIVVPQIRQEWLRFQQFFKANYTHDIEIYDWIIYRKLP